MSNENIISQNISMAGQPAEAAKMPSEKDIVVHTMPRRFMGSHPAASKAKGVGLIVLIGGLLVLAAALAFLYFYLADNQSDTPVVTTVEPETETPTNVKTNPPQTSAPVREEAVPPPETARAETPVIPAATSSALTSPISAATTTMATTTASGPATTTRIINAGATTTVPAAVKTSTDSDSDGLTDMEEVLFDCNISSSDSDGDGYDDLSEIRNFYNPAGAGSIVANPNIEKYINGTYNYALYYPYSWSVENAAGDDSVMFILGGNQFIQIIVQPNLEKKSLDDWYMEQIGVASVPDAARLYKKGWWALKSDDGLTVYLARPDNDNIFVMSYNLGAANIMQYPNIFDLMVKSMEIEN